MKVIVGYLNNLDSSSVSKSELWSSNATFLLTKKLFYGLYYRARSILDC